MATVNYFSFDGMILAEEAVGGAGLRTYGADALGSTVATYDNTGKTQNTYRYKPYGAQLAKTGTAADPLFTWVGSLGYRQTNRNYSDVYVRARHYSALATHWTTADPLWPQQPATLDPFWPMEHAYTYALANPYTHADPSGRSVNCDCITYEKCHQSISINDGKGNSIYKQTVDTFLNPPGCVHCGTTAAQEGAERAKLSRWRSPRTPIKIPWPLQREPGE